MEKIVEQTLLYDFYGDLLTDRQREVYEEIVFNDLSLSEAAEEYGISRQGIHDMIRRSENTLREYEEKLHMIHRFQMIRELTEEAACQLTEVRKALQENREDAADKALLDLEEHLAKIRNNLM